MAYERVNPTLKSLQWRHSPGWALTSFTIRLQASRSLAVSLHSFIPIFLRSVAFYTYNTTELIQ